MGQVSALTEGSNVKQTPACLCHMYKRNTYELAGGNGAALVNDELGSNFF